MFRELNEWSFQDEIEDQLQFWWSTYCRHGRSQQFPGTIDYYYVCCCAECASRHLNSFRDAAVARRLHHVCRQRAIMCVRITKKRWFLYLLKLCWCENKTGEKSSLVHFNVGQCTASKYQFVAIWQDSQLCCFSVEIKWNKKFSFWMFCFFWIYYYQVISLQYNNIN